MSAIQQLITEHIHIWIAADNVKRSGRGRALSNADSVYGIKKLRKLILELAVRGKLLPQDHEWKMLKLSDLGFWAIGSGFPTSEQGDQDSDILFVKVSDMNLAGNEKFIVVANNTITNETAKRIKVNVHSAGTVIFPKIGGAIATNKRRVLTRDTAIDNNCLGLTPKVGVTTDWLYLLLSSIDLSKYQAGTSVPALAQGVLQEIPVMLPDEKEQHRIIAKVDELMALCDQLESQHSHAAEAHEKLVSHVLGTLTQSQSADDFSANWQRIAAHFDTLFTTESSIDALKQTLLQLAVMGKLVTQDSNDEPASELLKRIQAEKAKLVAEGKIKKDKPLAAIGDDEKPFELANGWEWVRLELIAKVISGNAFSSEDFNESAGVKTIKITNAGVHEFIETNDYLPENFSTKYLGYLIKQGDLILAQTRPYISDGLKISICPPSYNNSLLNQRVVAIRLNKNMVNSFVYIFMKTPEVLSFYMNKFSNSGLQPNLKLSDVTELLIALPPVGEQHRIVAKVDVMMALCDQLKNRITAANQLQKKLADVMVSEATN